MEERKNEKKVQCGGSGFLPGGTDFAANHDWRGFFFFFFPFSSDSPLEYVYLYSEDISCSSKKVGGEILEPLMRTDNEV